MQCLADDYVTNNIIYFNIGGIVLTSFFAAMLPTITAYRRSLPLIYIEDILLIQ